MIRRPPRSTRTDTLFPYTTLFRSVTGIDAPRRLQPFELGFIEREPLRLPRRAVDIEPQPREIGADGRDMLLPRPLAVGVVDPQQETPAMLACPQPVVERGADVADMQIAGRRGGETGQIGRAHV